MTQVSNHFIRGISENNIHQRYSRKFIARAPWGRPDSKIYRHVDMPGYQEFLRTGMTIQKSGKYQQLPFPDM